MREREETMPSEPEATETAKTTAELRYEIPPRELQQLLASAQPPILLDVREDWERREFALAGSVHIPYDEISERLDELDPAAHIVAYCHVGVRSIEVAVWLRVHGYARVQSLRGGIDRWAQEIDPSLPRYEY